ncbi:MAG: hypothetical protein OEQ39_07370 [Gammaproteobacteria bacterium]|nr:hypothetical protein [Gammaproteobacteria bacterium]MDH3469504.1 hypothetical protein [Gammaproteobacteria bacterium]
MAEKQPTRAIVWDLDGTLVDSATDLAAALNALLTENDLTSQPVSVVRNMIGAALNGRSSAASRRLDNRSMVGM